MNVGELCSRQVVFVGRETSLDEAARLMREHHVGSLVVVTDRGGSRVPVGMLTDRDIVVAVVARKLNPEAFAVKGAMTEGVRVVREEEDVTDALRAMRERGVRRLPVVNAAGALVGIVTLDDLFEHVAQEMDGFMRALRSERAHEAQARA